MEYFSRDARNFDCSTLPFPAAWAAPIHGPVDVETAHFVRFCRGPVFDFEHVDNRKFVHYKTIDWKGLSLVR